MEMMLYKNIPANLYMCPPGKLVLDTFREEKKAEEQFRRNMFKVKRRFHICCYFLSII